MRVGEGKEEDAVDPVAEQVVAALDGDCGSDLKTSVDCNLVVDVVGVAIRIFVRIPFSLIVMISPGTMLSGTLTRNRFSFSGTGLSPSSREPRFSDDMSLCS